MSGRTVLDVTAVGGALEAVRELVRADGADIALRSVDAETGTVVLRLVLDDASCEECVMPSSILEAVATDVLRSSLAGVTSVSIDDPRTDAASAL